MAMEVTNSAISVSVSYTHLDVYKRQVYNKSEMVKDIYSALYASKLVSYAQGFAVLQRASDAFAWNLDLDVYKRQWQS